MMPTFASPGVILLGQFGPISVAALSAMIYGFGHASYQLQGFPLVMVMMTLMPASCRFPIDKRLLQKLRKKNYRKYLHQYFQRLRLRY